MYICQWIFLLFLLKVHLKLLHGSDVRRLDVVLILSNTVLKIIKRDLVVLNNTVDLQLLDTESDSNELRTTPDKSVHGNSLDVSEEQVKISLIIPRLNIKSYDRLGSGLSTLSSLLGSVISKSLLLELLSLLIDLVVVRSKKIDIRVLLFLSSGRGSSNITTKVRSLGSLVTGQSSKLLRVRSNLRVPTGSVGVLGSIRSGLNSLENGNISLGSVDALDVALVGKEGVESLEA